MEILYVVLLSCKLLSTTLRIKQKITRNVLTLYYLEQFTFGQATTVSPVAIQTLFTGNTEDTRRTATSNILSTSCPYCIGDHELTSCQHFNLQQHEKKVEFLKKNRFCFGCLVMGHLSTSCKKRMTCEICHRKHPMLLHISMDNKEKCSSHHPTNLQDGFKKGVKVSSGDKHVNSACL